MPSTELRKWFAHDPEKWAEFEGRYATELKQHGDQMAIVKEHAAHGPVTLLYGAKDEEHNEAIVLQRTLSRKP